VPYKRRLIPKAFGTAATRIGLLQEPQKSVYWELFF
jgi:hypothetical protein